MTDHVDENSASLTEIESGKIIKRNSEAGLRKK